MEQNLYTKHWNEWPFPVVTVPDKLNPFKDDGVILSVALACHLPYESIKYFTVYGLLSGAGALGMLSGAHTLVEATSGNTGLALTAMAKIFGSFRVKLVVAPDLPDGKRYPLYMAGAEIIPPSEGLSAIGTARKLGGGGWKADGWHSQNGVLNLDQYGNIHGTVLHRDFTASKILKQLTYLPTIFVVPIGTGGTAVGISNGLHRMLKKIKMVGVLCSPGQEIPGCRDLNRMKEITLPWRESLDEIVEIPTRPSYLASLWFSWILGLTAGPSSGFAYLGALKAIRRHKDAGTLDSLRDDRGRIHAVILFPDGNRPYGDRFMANLLLDYMNISTAPWPWQMPGNELW